tara:strand:+ start:1142 stop:2140 length:999 start_codon:yes stop_codon:yes gene_type:complete
MEFFDRKQEVLDIQLTPLGKRLMQMGRLKPKFYAFYDNDIIYDGEYAGIVETQNEIYDRIKETPRIKQQMYLYSAESKINKNTTANDLPIFQENLFQTMFEAGTAAKIRPEAVEKKQLELEGFGPLGNMSYNTEKAPAWRVDFFEAKLTGSLSVTTGSYSENIPKLECDIQYKLKVEQTSPEYASQIGAPGEVLDVDLEGPDETDSTYISADGSYLSVIEDSLFIKVLEKNTDFLNENFEVEVYRIMTEGIEERLYFSGISDDADPDTVEYFFDFNVDSQISDDAYCQAVRSEKLESTYTDTFIFNCSDLDEKLTHTTQIYDIPDDEVEACD